MKGGTEAFSFFLTLHTQVALPVDTHSTYFFTSNYDKGVAWYREQMVCASKGQVKTIYCCFYYYFYAIQFLLKY